MIVSMWMTRTVRVVRADESIAEAARIMGRHRVRRLPVITNRAGKDHLVGILSAADIMKLCGPALNPFAVEVVETKQSSASVAEIMQHDVACTTPETPIEEVAKAMLERKVGALPVMRDEELVGMITESDIFRAFVSLLAGPGQGVRVTFDISAGEDVFEFVHRVSTKHGMRVASLITSRQEDRTVCVVRIAGTVADVFLEELWNSGHRVLNVLRLDGGSARLSGGQ